MSKPNRKLSLTRETLLPLSATELDAVAGGVAPSGCVTPPLSRLSLPSPTGPRPSPSTLSDLGLTIHRPGQVSGQSNAL
jgi:hypothetical protein